jgi:hypothetical protein
MSIILAASAIDPRLGLFLNNVISSASKNGGEITEELFENMLLRLKISNEELRKIQTYLRSKGFNDLTIMEVLRYFHKGFEENEKGEGKKKFTDDEIDDAVDAVKKVSDKLDTLNIKPNYSGDIPPPAYGKIYDEDDDNNNKNRARSTAQPIGGKTLNRKNKKKTNRKTNRKNKKKYNKRKTKKYNKKYK